MGRVYGNSQDAMCIVVGNTGSYWCCPVGSTEYGVPGAGYIANFCRANMGCH
jgi:hypothetical protein